MSGEMFDFLVVMTAFCVAGLGLLVVFGALEWIYKWWMGVDDDDWNY